MDYCIIIPVVLGIALLVWYIREKIKEYSMKAMYIKTAVSVCFIATALTGMVCRGQTSLLYGAFITGGLIFGLMGDIVLDLKYIDREREDSHTKSGFIFFGIGHLLFMLAMYFRYGQFIVPSLLFAAVSLVIGFAAGFATAKSGPRFGNSYGEHFTIVALYSGMLASATVMALLYAVIYACAPSFFSPEPALILMFTGLAAFLVSDLILSRTYYGEGHHKPADIISNYAFYYAAQFIIALSIYSVK